MIRTWLLIGGLRDGEVVKVDDRDIRKECWTHVELEDVGGVVLKYRVFIRGGITDKLTGGVMSHESFKQAAVMAAMVEFYALWHKRVANMIRVHIAQQEAAKQAEQPQEPLPFTPPAAAPKGGAQ